MIKQIFSALKVVALALVFSFGLSYVYAWTAPTTTPPGGNVSAPINTSNTAQVMAGGLTVDSATSTKDIVVNGVTVGQGSGSPSWSTAIGMRALQANLTGRYNTATGVSALAANTAGWYNTANGYYALSANTGSSNTAVGTQALNANGSGYNNTAVGWQSLVTNSTGYSNTAIGYNANVNSNNLYNATAIGAGALVSASNEIQLGGGVSAVRTSGKIYAPSIQLSTGAALNKVLTSDASGNGTWATPAGGISGSGTANYMSKWTGGTSLGNSQVFDDGTNVGIGTTAPAAKLSVGGTGVSGTGVYGSGNTYGIQGISAATGVYGNGNTYGIQGISAATGVYGNGNTYGLYGNGGSVGVYGASPNNGVYGYSSGVSGNGVYGYGIAQGVIGYSSGSTGAGVYGGGWGSSGYGLYGVGSGGSGTGVWGQGNAHDFLGANGESTVGGVWTNAPSYRRYKENFSSTEGYLDKLMNLDMYEWQYKDEVIDGVNRYKSDPYRHASPFLDDFYNTFKLGTNNGYNIQDLAGVTISSVKELNKKVIDENQSLNEKIGIQQKEIDKLKTDNGALLKRVEAIEAKLK